METLIVRHTPLVEALSRRFTWRDDARQAGFLALTQAIRRFDVDRGTAFSTYAVPWVLGEMRKAGAETLPWRAQAAWHRACRAAEEIRRQKLREATVDEMARAAGVNAGELALLLEWRRPPERDLMDAPDPAGEGWMDRMLLSDLISRLSPDEKHLLRLRILEGRRQQDAAQALHISQAGVSRMEKALITRLRKSWQG